MKFLHTADLHIGKQLRGFSLIEDQRFILEQILALAEAHEVDGLLIAGDLYDKGNPSAEAVALLDWLFTEATARHIAVFAIPGNHDSAERVGYASAFLAREGVMVPPVFSMPIAPHTLCDTFGEVDVWLLPFLRPADVRHAFPEADIGTSYTAAVKTVIDSLPLDGKKRNVLLCHQFVVAGDERPAQSDSELSVGGIDQVDARVFEPFEYVALGHLHRPQRIGKDFFRYAGSPLKYSTSEIPFPKSVVLVELGAKGTPAETALLPLRPLRDVRIVRGSFAELIEQPPETEDFIVAQLSDETPPLDPFRRLRAVFPALIGIEYASPGADGAAFHGETEELQDLAHLDPAALFARFFEEQTGKALSKAQQAIINEELALALAEGREETGGAR